MKKTLFTIGIISLLFSCDKELKDQPESNIINLHHNELDLPDSLSSRRIQFALQLKQDVAKKYWQWFGARQTEGPFIYFNGDRSEVFFPDQRVIDCLDDHHVHSKDYVVANRTDSIPYHFELMISFDKADEHKHFYQHPVQQFISVEETETFIPSVNSTEWWITMVIHEMFHHFQYNTPKFLEYAKNEISLLPFNPNHMMQLCRDDKNFMSLIQKENAILMKALEENDPSKMNDLISQFLDLRKERMKTYQEDYPYLQKVEDYYVIQEGSARYLEFQSMQIMSEYANNKSDHKIANDPMFDDLEGFKNIDLTHPDFNYLTYAGPGQYHYTLGFNMMRLLDKIGVDYKADLLNNPEYGLHKYLRSYLQGQQI
tara:strand:+ start:36405 stop:37517 length:1113 start_codon:yes stop_codon:yes gene_type:complete